MFHVFKDLFGMKKPKKKNQIFFLNPLYHEFRELYVLLDFLKSVNNYFNKNHTKNTHRILHLFFKLENMIENIG